MSSFLNEMRYTIVCNTILRNIQDGPFVILFLCHIRLIRPHVIGIGKDVTLMTSASSASI